jgi:hypothetical protein
MEPIYDPFAFLDCPDVPEYLGKCADTSDNKPEDDTSSDADSVYSAGSWASAGNFGGPDELWLAPEHASPDVGIHETWPPASSHPAADVLLVQRPSGRAPPCFPALFLPAMHPTVLPLEANAARGCSAFGLVPRPAGPRAAAFGAAEFLSDTYSTQSDSEQSSRSSSGSSTCISSGMAEPLFDSVSETVDVLAIAELVEAFACPGTGRFPASFSPPLQLPPPQRALGKTLVTRLLHLSQPPHHRPASPATQELLDMHCQAPWFALPPPPKRVFAADSACDIAAALHCHEDFAEIERALDAQCGTVIPAANGKEFALGDRAGSPEPACVAKAGLPQCRALFPCLPTELNPDRMCYPAYSECDAIISFEPFCTYDVYA